MWWYRALHVRAAWALARRLGPPGVVLDAGCGTGGTLHQLSLHGMRDLIGLEYNRRAALRAQAKSGLPVVGGDVNALPFGSESLSAVLSLDVLCHRAVDPDRALAEFRRVLKPGGTLILNMPAYEWLHSAHDIRVHNARRSTAQGLRMQLEAAGYARVETRYWNALLFPLMVLQRKIIARGAQHASDVGDFPAWLDTLLYGVTKLEHGLARIGLRYPAGGSILAIATRP